MFKIINLDNLPTGNELYKQFRTEDEAQAHLHSVAQFFSKSGYQVENIPATEGVFFNDPQMLKVTRVFNVSNPNASDNVVVYALIPHEEGELVTITRNCMKYYGETEDETNYNFVATKETVEELHARLSAEGYILMRKEENMLAYKSETETFISEIYVL